MLKILGFHEVNATEVTVVIKARIVARENKQNKEKRKQELLRINFLHCRSRGSRRRSLCGQWKLLGGWREHFFQCMCQFGRSRSLVVTLTAYSLVRNSESVMSGVLKSR